MKGKLLKCNTRWGVTLEELKLPVFYHDKSAINAIYTASTKQVKKYLPDPRMHPVEVEPGRCLVSFSAFEYRLTDIGLFNEFSIAFIISYGAEAVPGVSPCSLRKRKCFDMYIRHLPVTTETARIGGVETYGFPKSLAEISFCRENGKTECRVTENNTDIISLQVPELQTNPGHVVLYRAYASHRGVTLRSNIYTKNHEFAESTETKDVVLSIGNNHRICKELRAIDLGEYALMFQYIPSSESILSIPRNFFCD